MGSVFRIIGVTSGLLMVAACADGMETGDVAPGWVGNSGAGVATATPPVSTTANAATPAGSSASAEAVQGQMSSSPGGAVGGMASTAGTAGAMGSALEPDPTASQDPNAIQAAEALPDTTDPSAATDSSGATDAVAMQPDDNSASSTQPADNSASSTQPPDSSAAGGPSGGDPAVMPVDMPVAVPEPVDVPFVWGVGLAVGDLDAAQTFFQEVMAMEVEREAVQRDGYVETVLYAASAKRGSRLVLMKFADDRDTRGITAKLVWQVTNAGAVDRAASSYPDYVSRVSFLGIYQFDGPDTYIQEVGGAFDADAASAASSDPYLVALGFSVSDLDASLEFYESAFGFESTSLGSFAVTDVNGAGRIQEYWSAYPTGGGAGVVLQDWSPERNSKNNPVKIVHFVPDAEESAAAVVAAGGSIVQEAERSAAYDNRLLIVAQDPDGYVLELVQ